MALRRCSELNTELSFLDSHAEEASVLDVKLAHDWLQANRAQDGRYSDALYLHAVEAGFEVVRGNGWASISATN